MLRRAGGTKKNFFLVDYNRNWSDRLAICLNLNKSNHNTALIALIKYSNGTYSYILASTSLKPGCYTFSTIKPLLFFLKKNDKNCNVLLKFIKPNTIFFNLEIYTGCGGAYARSAGVFCRYINQNFEKELAFIRLPTGKTKKLSIFNKINLGRVSNILHYKEFYTKAGFFINKGYRPSVRGVAMNPVDHPHGGRTKTNSPELTPWGKIAKLNK